MLRMHQGNNGVEQIYAPIRPNSRIHSGYPVRAILIPGPMSAEHYELTHNPTEQCSNCHGDFIQQEMWRFDDSTLCNDCMDKITESYRIYRERKSQPINARWTGNNA